MEPSDYELLRRYVGEGSEEAFAELIRRRLDLAWGAAFRITGDAELARDVAQQTFCDLARKARFLSESVVVSGWIYRAACLQARRSVRDAARRAAREIKAMEMHSSTSNESESSQETIGLLRRLDASLCALRRKDREAIVLRFLEKKSLAEVGEALGVSEDAAQKRVSRAVEKLRSRLVVGTGALTGALGVAASQAAPAGLAASVASGATTAAGVSGLSAILLQLKAQIIVMKTQLVTGTLTAVVFATPLAIQYQNLRELREENVRLVQTVGRIHAVETNIAGLAYRDRQARELARLKENHAELIRLREEVAVWQSGEVERKRKLAREAEALEVETERLSREADLLANAHSIRIKTIEDMKGLGLAARIFATDHEDRLPESFEEMSAAMKELHLSELDLSRYEFYPHDEPVSEYQPEKILFRERHPRRMPGGSLQRCYTLTDGSVQTIDGGPKEFNEFEARQNRSKNIAGKQ